MPTKSVCFKLSHKETQADMRRQENPVLPEAEKKIPSWTAHSEAERNRLGIWVDTLQRLWLGLPGQELKELRNCIWTSSAA